MREGSQDCDDTREKKTSRQGPYGDMTWQAEPASEAAAVDRSTQGRAMIDAVNPNTGQTATTPDISSLSQSQQTPVRPTDCSTPSTLYTACIWAEVNCVPRSELNRIRFNSDYAEKSVKPKLGVLASVPADWLVFLGLMIHRAS